MVLILINIALTLLCVYLVGRGVAQLTGHTEEELYLSWPDEDVLEHHRPCVSVQGRLKTRAEFWANTLQASSFVQEIVRSGYRLPFLRYPTPVCMRNHRSALEEKDFVRSAIGELLTASCIVECDECPSVCSPLLVVKNAKGKRRLVVDLRVVNQCLPKQKFKYEGLNLIPDLCYKDEYFVTFDLKSGYHHVDISKDCWPYLGFSWDFKGVRRFFMFRVLPFGLSTACYVFTKLLRPLVKRWRSMGLRASMTFFVPPLMPQNVFDTRI